EHPAVAECGVVAAPDEERGQIVKAYVVLRAGYSGDAAVTKTLQEHVKATIAPYKYPRTIEYVAQLPRTQTGKLQRFELRRTPAAPSPRLASCPRSRHICFPHRRSPRPPRARPAGPSPSQKRFAKGWIAGSSPAMTSHRRPTVSQGPAPHTVLQPPGWPQPKGF